MIPSRRRDFELRGRSRAAATRRPLPDGKTIRFAVEALRGSRRPLPMVGAGANRNTTSRMLCALVDDERFPIHRVRLVTDVGRALGENDVLCLDNGMYELWFARYHRARYPNTLLLDERIGAARPLFRSGPITRRYVKQRREGARTRFRAFSNRPS